MDQRVPQKSWDMWLAFLLNGFAFVVVNYWIYTARWDYVDALGDTLEYPPTISRAISLPHIGEPFSIWISVSGLALIGGVGLLARRYLLLRHVWQRPDIAPWLMIVVGIPVVLIFQLLASYGIITLSTNRFPHDREMHMMGSYFFFIFQALVILFYTILNHMLLRESEKLKRAEAMGLIKAHWVKGRFVLGCVSVGIAVLYGLLFYAKDVYPYADTPWVYSAYVSTELAAITSFLVVMAMAHGDKLGLPFVSVSLRE